MTHPSPQQYLESKVLTASQPQLHRMLLDGALRFGRQAQKIWEEEACLVEANTLLERMTEIVEELIRGTAKSQGEISEQLEGQYAFVYRELVACRINEDSKQLASCLALLSYQRETWRLASERLQAEARATTDKIKPVQPHLSKIAMDSEPVSVGFSLEA